MSIKRGRCGVHMAIAFCVAAFIILAWAPSHGDAATRYDHAGTYGSLADFSPVQRMAVHQETGRLFITDHGGNRVRVYEPDEDDLLVHVADITAANRDAPTDNLNEPTTIAVDQASGELYVAKIGAPAELVRFELEDPMDPTSYIEDASFSSPTDVNWGQVAGNFSTNLSGGLAIGRDGSNQPIILVADPAADLLWAFTHSGEPANVFPGGLFGAISSFNCGSCSPIGAFADLVDLAAGPDGSIYAADVKGGAIRVIRIALDGGVFKFNREWNPGLTPTTSARVAVDELTHEIFVANSQRYAQIEGPTANEIKFVSANFPPVFGTSRTYTTGIAVLGTPDPASGGRLYVGGVQAPTIGFGINNAQIDVYASTGEQVDLPEVSLDPIDEETDVSATSVSLSGTVVPFEPGSMWRFEARLCDPTCGAWPADPPGGPQMQGPIVASDYGVPQPVAFTIEGLQPNKSYEVRLRGRNSAGTAFSPTADEPAVKITTKLAAPDVETSPAASISPYRATLVGRIDPRNSDTRYHFELTTEHGETRDLPTVPEPIEADQGSTQVTAEVTGLDPDTEYSYRLLANLEDAPSLATEGETQFFKTRPAEDARFLERAYELVSPAYTNGGTATAYRLSPDGNHAFWTTAISLPDSTNTGFDQRVSDRNLDGTWTPNPFRAGPTVDPDSLSLDAGSVPTLNSMISHAGFSAGGAHVEEDLNGTTDFYMRSLTDGNLSWLTPADSGVGVDGAGGRVYYISDDGSIVIFGSARQLLATAHGFYETLYEWHKGELRQVGLLPGSPAASPSGRSFLGSGYTRELRNAVSRNGKRIAFSVTAGPTSSNPQSLYVNDEGEIVTVRVGSGSNRAEFWGADEDMNSVFYTYENALWEFDLQTKVNRQVTPSAGVERVLHVSNDGNRLYFASTGDVTASGRDTDPYALWVAERQDGEETFSIKYITAFTPGRGSVIGYSEALDNYSNREYSADPEGVIFAFVSRGQLVPGRPVGNKQQVYAYEAAREMLYCLSCPVKEIPQADVNLVMGGLQGRRSLFIGEGPTANYAVLRDFAWEPTNAPPRLVTSGGSVFFAASYQLVPEDVNRNWDVYEWRGGEVSLISSGKGSRSDSLAEASEDGKTVLFTSTESLVPGLPEAALFRSYVARADGGANVTDPPKGVCLGPECRNVVEAPAPPERGAAQSRHGGSQGEAGARCRMQARKLASARLQLRRQRAGLVRLKRLGASERKMFKQRGKVERLQVQVRSLARGLRACRRAA